MAKLKIVFNGKDVKVTVGSKSINETKLKWFLELIDKRFVTNKTISQIRIYRGTRKVRDCYFDVECFDNLWNDWIDYNKNKKENEIIND